MTTNENIKEGMRRALEMIGLIDSKEFPGKYINEYIKESVPDYPVLTPENAHEAVRTIGYAAFGGAKLTHWVMRLREQETGKSLTDQLAELGLRVNMMPTE